MADSELSKSAFLVMDKIQERGFSLHSYSNVKQSTQLEMLFKELDKVKDAISKIKDADNLLNDLIKAQADFERVYSEKVSAESQKVSYSTNDLKKDICYYLNGAISYLDINQSIGPEKYKAVASVVDEIITDIHQNARARNSRKQKPDKANNSEQPNSV
jgi:hypothetical protein